ncbi:MAG: carboxypeptidase regulatory-like domain-containing protein [Bacteroidota bacterium]
MLLFAPAVVLAQAGYNVSGIITNDKGEPLKNATVFIGGSTRVKTTDETGHYSFSNLSPGTFQLSVQLLGYMPVTRNIIVKGAPLKVDIQMQTKSITLEQVTIGKKGASEKNLKLFKDMFLGQSINGKQCVILNPEIINFSTKKGILLADADDFLIIENKRLGYRLHYLLNGFSYNHVNRVVVYHGECSFEELDGTEIEKAQWAKNRVEAYQGSFMHFLRSVYANTTLENGFITKPLYGYATIKYDTATVQLKDKIIIQDRPVKFDSLITAVDTNFTSFKFKQQLYVTYNPKSALRFQSNRSDTREIVALDQKGSVLRLESNQAIIDKKGSYTDYRDFFIYGYWAAARVGDQLPVEYKSPVADIPHRNVLVNPRLAALRKWTDSIPQEKAYLHMDKPYYATGDTIWFKGYLTTGSRHRLSALSGAAYVDLINEQNQSVKTLKLPVDSGTVAGNIILAEDVKEGSYRIRAYTRWMRNAGEAYFFTRTFTVGNPIVASAKKDIKPTLQQTDVQFFPESGNLINGITSKVGFKAVGIDGLGETISGKITDNEQNEVAEIASLHAGMGNFLLKPLPGKTYTAIIKFADSTTKKIVLPTTLNEGYVLSVYQPNKDSILVRIQATPNLQHTTVNLIVHSSGEITFMSPVEINSAMTSIWLDKESFPSGIAQFTIFNTNNEPLNERIAFIKNNDHMQLAIKTEKTIYKSKEHVQLELNAKNSEGIPIAANFSVAVIDESKAPIDESAESTIFSNILLSSDIKGYIEKPNYYFTTDTVDVNKALDNLMLTQGYSRFEWNSLNNDVNNKPKFQVEGLGVTISGSVKTLTHQALPNAVVLLVSTNARINKTTIADANGRFKFDNLVFADSAKFAVQAKGAQNSDHAIITLDSIPQMTINSRQNLTDINSIRQTIKKAEQDGKPLQLTGLHVLKQVNIKAVKNNNDKNISIQGMFKLPDEESADKIIKVPDNEPSLTLAMFLQARIPGVSVENDAQGFKQLVEMRSSIDVDPSSNKPVDHDVLSVILDGRLLRSNSEVDEVLSGSLLPQDVARILVVRTNRAMVSYGGKAIYIITKPPSARKQYNPNIANITPKGFNKVRQFYSPRYDGPNSNTKLPDLRTTIFWDPYVNTDVKGKAMLDFFNADGSGTYRVVIEGINAAGELGRQVFNYKVE